MFSPEGPALRIVPPIFSGPAVMRCRCRRRHGGRVAAEGAVGDCERLRVQDGAAGPVVDDVAGPPAELPLRVQSVIVAVPAKSL